MSCSWRVWILLNFACIHSVHTDCTIPLGMEDGTIKDNQITSPYWLHSITKSYHFSAPLARLNMKSPSGSWCSEDVIKIPNQYIEIDLLQNKKITGISTQGRYNGTKHAEEYIENYRLAYQRDGENNFRNYTNEVGDWELLAGNTDNIETVKHFLRRTIIGRKIRIYPVGREYVIHCLRLELYGCNWSHLTSGLVSYESPRGGELRGINLRDKNYDGTYNDTVDVLNNGLGRLTDDIFGKMSLLTDSWIGYNTENPELKFSFTTKRLFKKVLIHVNNNGDEIKIFEKLDIYVGADDGSFSHLTTYLPTEKEKNHIDAFAVIVQLGSHVLTKQVKLLFTKNSHWLLLSEILFITDFVDGKIVTTNKTPGAISEVPVDGQAPNKNENTTRLSFPIILTIALVTCALAVAVTIVIYRSYKKKRKPPQDSRPLENHQQYPPSLPKQALLYDEKLLVMQQKQLQQQHNALLVNTMYMQQPHPQTKNYNIVMS